MIAILASGVSNTPLQDAILVCFPSQKLLVAPVPIRYCCCCSNLKLMLTCRASAKLTRGAAGRPRGRRRLLRYLIQNP